MSTKIMRYPEGEEDVKETDELKSNRKTKLYFLGLHVSLQCFLSISLKPDYHHNLRILSN